MKKFTWQFLLTICLCCTLIVLDPGNQAGRAGAEETQADLGLCPFFLLLLNSSGDQCNSITAVASVSQTSGAAPLTVTFNDHSCGKIESYRWDFDGDSVWDWAGAFADSQSYTYTLPGPYTAVLQVEDAQGNTSSQQVVIEVHDNSENRKPSVTFSTTTDNLLSGQTATLSWSVTDAETVTISPDVGSVALTGSTSVFLTSSARYTLTATGAGGIETVTKDINVFSPAADELLVYITSPAEGQRVAFSTVTVSGIVNPLGAQVYVNGVPAAVDSDSFSVQMNLPPGANTLIATVSKDGQTVQDSSWVVTDFTRERQPQGSFGDVYEALIPVDSTKASYDEEKFSVITGLVENEVGTSLPGVTASILKHPEYGTSTTDGEGRFALPVEGGTTYTIVYEHPNYITAQRRVTVGENSIPLIELVRLVMLDHKSTRVTFDNDPDTIITHTSTLVTDTAGNRSTTMVFQGDNPAWEVDEQGQRIRKLDTIVTRATEFTTPETMPSVLPPTSAYTYCADLTVDGAERVEFDKPVVIWVDNFIAFPVGTIVPIGYYDRDRGAWRPSDNGVVAKLLDTNNDGVVDAIDATGDGVKDDLDGDGRYDDEVEGLGDAARYQPDTTFWRGEVTHFTPWDLNWPYDEPDDFIEPYLSDIDFSDSDFDMSDSEYDSSTPKDKQFDKSGCRIEPYGRILNEEVYIPGTEDLNLTYKTSRTDGYGNAITIPVIGDTVPTSLIRIHVSLYVGGRKVHQTLESPESNAAVEFYIPSEDVFGNPLTGEIKVEVELEYVYSGTFAVPEEFQGQVFAEFGKEPLEQAVRYPFSTWDFRTFTIIKEKSGSKLENGLPNGWSLLTQHRIEPTAPSRLIKGDGTTVRGASGIIDTVIGGGETSCSQDLSGTLALAADLDNATGIAEDSKGNFYFSSSDCHQVYKMDTDGYLTRIAGKPGTESCSHLDSDAVLGDGGPATGGTLCRPAGLAFDKDDNLYIADSRHRRVRKVDTSGIITTVMGNGFPSLSYGDFTEFTNRCMQDCTVNDNTLGRVFDLTIDEDGNIYLPTGEGLNTIGKINTNGIYHTIGGACNPNDSWSGGGDECSGGEGDYTNEVGLNPYRGITYGPNGSIYFVNDYNEVAKISPTGVFSTVAVFSEDSNLGGLTQDPNGNIYVVDRRENYIYRVDLSGQVTLLVGTGDRSTSAEENGDGGFAVDAKINAWDSGYYGSGLHYSNNTLYFADSKWGLFRSVRGALFNFDTFKEAEDDLVFAEEGSLVHIFDATGQHKKTVHSETGITLRAFQYDQNRLQSISNQFGQSTTLQYSQEGDLVSITSATGIVTTLTIDSDKNLTRILFADNTDFTFTYDENNLMLSKTEPAGNVFTHEYNTIGKLTNVADELGGSWEYEVEKSENEHSRIIITTAEGNTKTIDDTYTSTGRNEIETTYPSSDVELVVRKSNKSEATLANGMKQTVQYNVDQEFGYMYEEQVKTETPVAGLILEVNTSKEYEDTNVDNLTDLFTTTVSINDRDTVAVFDRSNSTVTITSAGGRRATQTFSEATLQPLTEQFADLNQSSYEYDGRGNLIQMNQGNREQSMTYDLGNNLVAKTQPEGQVIGYTHDIFGRVTSVTRPGGNITSFEYDANGMASKVTTPMGSQYTFSYNKANKIAGISLPDTVEQGIGGSYQFGYDMDRHLMTITYPSTGTVSNTYTGDRLISKSSSDGTIISIEYETGDRVKKRTRGSESVAYTYDGALLLNTIHSGALVQTISRTYNDNFELASLSYAGTIQELYYDDDGLLEDINDEIYIYRDSGTGLADGVEDDYYYLEKSFNGYGGLNGEDIDVYGLSLDVESSWSVTRNRNGQIVTLSENFNNQSSYEYTYDDLGRLTTVKKDDSTVESYAYDANGNRTLDTGGNVYTYDAQDRLIGKESITFTYTADGFLASRTESGDDTSYEYSLIGELKKVTKPDGVIITYTYDPLGRRITKAIDGSIVEKYLWYSNTALLAVYDGADILKYRFEYADKEVPLRMIDNNGVAHYYIGDHLGSLRQVVDEEGTIVRSIDYDSFGNILVDTDPDSDIPFGFAGGLFDTDTGLIHFGFRDYDPEIGRWTARDPILFAGKSSNLYTYVENDPVNFTDRVGLSPKKEGPPAGRKKGISGNTGSFVKDMAKLGGDFLYDTAEALAWVNYQLDNSDDADQKYHQELDEIRKLEEKGDEGADLWENFVNLTSMGGNAGVDVKAEGMSQAGKGIESWGNTFGNWLLGD